MALQGKMCLLALILHFGLNAMSEGRFLSRRFGAVRKVATCPSDSHATRKTQRAMLSMSEHRVELLNVEEEPSSPDEGEEEVEINHTYKYIGCYELQNPDEDRVKPGSLMSMTTHKCYTQCKKEHDKGSKARFFMIRNGRYCTCLQYVDRVDDDEKKCNVECAGDESSICGGVRSESVYVMVDCPVLPKSKAELAREARTKETYERAKKESEALREKELKARMEAR